MVTQVPAAHYTQRVTTRYDEKCYNGGIRSSVAYNSQRLPESLYPYTHTRSSAYDRRSAGKGGLRTPMHMRHMQPHTHRRKPHTPGGERGWWWALKRRGGSAQRRGIPFHVARHARRMQVGDHVKVPAARYTPTCNDML